MTVGLLKIQLQNDLRFKSLFSRISLFIHNPTFIHQIFSLSSTRGMTNCIGTEGVTFTEQIEFDTKSASISML